MIGKAAKPGEKTIGLLHYLYRLNSHHKDPHVIGGFQSAGVLEPLLKPNGKPDLQKLAQVLEAPLALAETSALKDGSKLVYHFCFRAAPGDRRMDDEEWMVFAREAMHRLGVAPRGRVYWSGATFGLVGRGRKEVTPALATVFAAALGIPAADLAAIGGMLQPAEAEIGLNPSAHAMAKLTWEARRLTAGQVKFVHGKAEAMRHR